MYTSFKIQCVNQIEQQIEFPQSGWFVKTDQSIRLAWITSKGLQKKTLTRLEAAAYLKQYRFIDEYSKDGKMYRKELKTVIADNAPVQFEDMVLVPWEDVHITKIQLRHIAALIEYDATTSIMGNVVNITKSLAKAAAVL